MRWFFLGVMAVIFPFSTLFAQDIPQTEMPQTAEIFPLTMVLDKAGLIGNGCNYSFWQPDWPFELPPDSFKVRSGKVTRAAIEGDGVSLVLCFDSEGRIGEFPFMLNGRIAQVSLVYREALELHEMVLAFQAEEEAWKFEFLEYSDSYPSLVRGSCGDLWVFISLSKRGNAILETWYNEEGIALGAYIFSLIEIGETLRVNAFRDHGNPGNDMEFFYDSRNLLTESSGFNGVYKVLYFREDLPRYWERRPAKTGMDNEDPGNGTGNFTLQWDQGGFLLRIAENSEKQGTDSQADGRSASVPAEYRYEYTLDEEGNWIERQEIRMIRRFGLLVPSQGTTVKRILEYDKPE